MNASRPAEQPGQPGVPEASPVPERLNYTSPPALMTAVVLSIVLLSFAMFGWWAIGEDIRSQITWAQGGTLLFLVLLMIAIMLSIGYSRLWADERGVIVRNGPIIRKYAVDQIAGVRLRPGDAWCWLLLKTADGEDLKRAPVLAIQFLEGEQGRAKVVDLRRWLVARGATSGSGTDPTSGSGTDPTSGSGTDPTSGSGTDPTLASGTDPTLASGTDTTPTP